MEFTMFRFGKLNYNSHLKLIKAFHNVSAGRANPALFICKKFPIDEEHTG